MTFEEMCPIAEVFAWIFFGVTCLGLPVLMFACWLQRNDQYEPF
jgi:hypothetical protein